MRLALLVLVSVSTASAQDGPAPRWPSAPTDTLRWEAVADTLGRRVFVDVETLRPGGVVDVWTWRAFAEARPPYRPYDREVGLDRVFCALRATAPLRVARYRDGASVGAFMYPPSVGPYGWAPGSAAEAVGERACREDPEGQAAR